VLVGGSQLEIGGVKTNGVLRLNVDGSVDPSFHPTVSGPNNWYNSLMLQTDGKVLVNGRFTTLGGQPCTNFGRLYPDGTLDASLPQIADFVGYAGLYGDGALLVQRKQYDGVTSGLLTNSVFERKLNSAPASESLSYEDSAVTWLRGGTAPEVWRTRFAFSFDGTHWVDLGPGTRIPGGWQLSGVSVPAGHTLRALGYVLRSYGQFFEYGPSFSDWHVESQLPISKGRPAILVHDGNLKYDNGHTAFRFCGETGKQLVIEVSSDRQHWSAVCTNTMGAEALEFIDADNATHPRRFYRVRQE